MSYPVKVNEVAYVRYSEEPVFVTAIVGDKATVRRAITGAGGTQYDGDEFFLDELISEKARVIANLEMTKFQAEKRDIYAKAYQDAATKKLAPATPAMPSVADGTGYSN